MGRLMLGVNKKERVTEIFRRLEAANPHPTTELRYANAYELLVAVVLSAQATDVGVNKATVGLFGAAPDPAAMVRLGEAGIGQYVKTIGLWRNKAKNVLALSEILLRDYGGEVPMEREALEALPGVGRKTANVVLNTLMGLPVIAVDTHVYRVGMRLGLAKAKTPLALEGPLTRAVPPAYRRHAHHWLILHGRYVCTARAPKCGGCVVRDLCPSRD